MYHPGKVLEILSSNDKDIKSSDETTQAIVEMWDENQFTFLVDSKLSKKIKKNNIVLVDYSPISEKLPLPKHLVVKILNGKLGQEIWNNYKKYNEKNKRALAKSMQSNIAQQYMG
ncbi:hypothetical protein HYX18_02405 [Candidatus Woesearchaeota archaeon]|nr:hypothetical protein [Candidatus Woesearchaeota archaeon]